MRRKPASASPAAPPRRPGEPQRPGHRRLALEREVGQDGRHRGLVDQPAPEGLAVRGPVDRLGHAEAHHRRRPEDAVVAGAADHRHDRPHATALLADERRPRAVEDDLGGRVGPVAELVLQAVDAEPVEPAVLVAAGGRGSTTGRRAVGEHEEGVRRHRGDEPLRARQLVLARRPPARPRAAAAEIRPAGPLGQRHPDERPGLLRRRQLAGGRSVRRHQRLPARGQLAGRAAAPARRSRSWRSGT